ncbi:Aminopeptidase 2 mitochondrial [Xylographa bjoerkii]|nr:Aminopeptidase 2 mitochondrial [Xylographa bjoerkii]
MVSTTEGRQVLPANVKPIHYTLELQPSLKTFEVEGSVTIELTVVENSSEISLNVFELEISSMTLRSASGQQHEPKSVMYHDFHLSYFEYHRSTTRPSSDGLQGFYRSSYTQNGVKKYMAASQMEAIDARKAFPCFDEPALKATFDVTLITDLGLTCLSNMDVSLQSDIGKGKQKVAFARSPPMSTYLIAFAVGDLEYIETDAFRVPLRVYTPPGYAASGQYALELAVRTLKFYEEAFDIPFPLPKMDMVG